MCPTLSIVIYHFHLLNPLNDADVLQKLVYYFELSIKVLVAREHAKSLLDKIVLTIFALHKGLKLNAKAI